VHKIVRSKNDIKLFDAKVDACCSMEPCGIFLVALFGVYLVLGCMLRLSICISQNSECCLEDTEQ
jgi:hypothetical protein